MPEDPHQRCWIGGQRASTVDAVFKIGARLQSSAGQAGRGQKVAKLRPATRCLHPRSRIGEVEAVVERVVGSRDSRAESLIRCKTSVTVSVEASKLIGTR